LKKNEQFTLSFSVPKIDAKYSAIFYQYWICLLAENLDSDKEELPLFIISLVEVNQAI